MRKLNYEYVKKYFEDQGCQLLEKEYKNNSTPLSYICKCGKQSKTPWAHFRKSKMCKNCSIKAAANNLRFSYEYVKKYFEDQGCQLLEKEYKGIHCKLKCKKKSTITFANFKKGKRCASCGGVEKYKYDYVKKYFSDHNCKLLEKEYVGTNHKMRYICHCGRESTIRWNNFRKGTRCSKCAYENNSKNMLGDKNWSWNPNREQIALFKLMRSRYDGIVRRMFNGSKRAARSHIVLGYTRKELITHLTKHPNWDKVRCLEWDIDHIFPLKAFFEHNIHDPKIINALDNLQPMTKSENSAKSDTYDLQAFKQWVATKGILI
jgi:hypothetical protein